MDIIVEIIVPVFGIVGIGYGAARLTLFSQEATRGLSTFVFHFAIPAMLFRAMATTELPAEIQWGYLVSYFGGGYGAWLVGTLLSRTLFRRDGAGPTVAGMTAGFSNTVLLGVPLILTTFGDRATLPLFLLIAFHSSQLLCVATIQAEVGIGGRGETRQLLTNVRRELVRNPIIGALLAGILYNLSGLPLPGVVDSLTENLGRAAMPCAVFAMGASLAGYRLSGATAEAGVGVGLKLILHPLLVWVLATHLLDVEPLWRDIAVILAALPVGVNVYLVAQRYQAGVAAAATAILVSTAVSVLSVAAVLTLLAVR